MLLLYFVPVLVNILPVAPFIQCWRYHNTTQQTQTQRLSALLHCKICWIDFKIYTQHTGTNCRKKNSYYSSDLHCSFSDLIWMACDPSSSKNTSFCLSVCPSVRPSVCLSHLFHWVPVIVSSWNFQELLPLTKVMSMQKVKVIGQRSRSQRSKPNLAISGL